nr:hypothetical protein [Roseovarius aestuarii]
MGVTRDDRVDTGQIGQRQRDIFLERIIIVGVDAGMCQGDNDIRARCAHLGQTRPGGIHDIAGDQPVIEVKMIPCGNLRRHQTKQADAYFVLIAIAVGHLPMNKYKWRVKRFVIANGGSLGDHSIGASNRKRHIREHRLQPVESEVEFMIAQTSRIIAQVIHGRNGRVWAGPAAAGLRRHVTKRRALQKVTIINKQRMRHLIPCLLDQCSSPRQPKGVFATICVIVEGQQVAMNIGRLQNPQTDIRGALRYPACQFRRQL